MSNSLPGQQPSRRAARAAGQLGVLFLQQMAFVGVGPLTKLAIEALSIRPYYQGKPILLLNTDI